MKLNKIVLLYVLGHSFSPVSYLSHLQTLVISRYGARSPEFKKLQRIIADDQVLRLAETEDAGELALAITNSTIRHFYADIPLVPSEIFSERPLSFLSLEKLEYGVRLGSEDDTPCATQEECDAIADKMSICANLRETVSQVYSDFQQLTNVLANVMTALCGCIFVASAHVCVLQSIPYTCGWPYQIYGVFTNFGNAVWDAERTLSSMCSTMSDPSFAVPIDE